MIKEWVAFTDSLLSSPEFFHTGGKRITRHATFKTTVKTLKQEDLTLDTLGFSKKKLNMLDEYYYNEESVKVALQQFNHRRGRDTYGSAGITCYNHFSKRERPTHGPCIQSIVLTNVGRKGQAAVDIFYRTTEAFKKFAADLIWLRTKILPQLALAPDTPITFHFANATYHPMYWAVAAPYLHDPIAHLEGIRKLDYNTYKGIIRWTYRYVSNDPSLLKFKQGYRVAKHLLRLMPKDRMKPLTVYITKHAKALKKERADALAENNSDID